jgi:hypothetical protein
MGWLTSGDTIKNICFQNIDRIHGEKAPDSSQGMAARTLAVALATKELIIWAAKSILPRRSVVLQ